MKIETKRLILRPPRKSDWRDIVEGVNNLKVSRMLAVVPYPYKKKDAELWINDCLKKWKKKNKDDYTFFIELKESGGVIGATGIHKIDYDNSICMTGTWIGEKHWRKGYIYEVKLPILDFIFKDLKLRRVETAAYEINIPSQKMSKRIGFKLEGYKRQCIVSKATGKIHDEYVYGMLVLEWRKNRLKLIKYLKKQKNA